MFIISENYKVVLDKMYFLSLMLKEIVDFFFDFLLGVNCLEIRVYFIFVWNINGLEFNFII